MGLRDRGLGQADVVVAGAADGVGARPQEVDLLGDVAADDLEHGDGEAASTVPAAVGVREDSPLRTSGTTWTKDDDRWRSRPSILSLRRGAGSWPAALGLARAPVAAPGLGRGSSRAARVPRRPRRCPCWASSAGPPVAPAGGAGRRPGRWPPPCRRRGCRRLAAPPLRRRPGCSCVVVGLSYTLRLRVSGDEPHYLLMAQSLWREHDLDLRDNHAREDWREYTPGPIVPHYGAPARGRPALPGAQPGPARSCWRRLRAGRPARCAWSR